jgi:pimeloyl-ACP methyl ester carboxylesterase
VIDTYAPEAPFRPALPVPAEVSSRFEYSIETLPDVNLAWQDRAASVSTGIMTIQIPQDALPTPVTFEFWRSHRAEGRAPLIILTPILGGGAGLTRTQCRALTEAGFHVIYAKRGTRVLREEWSVDELELWLRRAVAGRRALIDWALTRDDVDPRRIGGFGVSMGGMITTVLTAAEPRIHSSVIALAGGDVPGVITVSSEGRLIRYRERKVHELQTDLRGLEELLRERRPSDPGAMAAYIDPRRVLQITACLDTVVPPNHQEALWNLMGRPLRYDLPASHYSGILYLPYLMEVGTRWLQRRFDSVGPSN